METLKIIHKSNTGATCFIEKIFFDNSLLPQSYAALILLNDMFRKLDVDYISEYQLRAKKIGFSRVITPLTTIP